MTIRIAVNGLGRIGRLVTRNLLKREDLELVAFNDLLDLDHLAYLLKYDSTHGALNLSIEVGENCLIIDGKKIHCYSEKDPEKLPWKELAIDFVVESTGLFLSRETAQKHINAGAKKVVLSAPAKDADISTFVMGVNHLNYKKQSDHIVSNASCTTNCLAPIAKVIMERFGIIEGLMTTIHAVTAGQMLVDGPSRKDWRGGRSGLQNIIPASTGAAKAVALCMPELKGKLTGMAFRVPLADVSVVDLTVRIKKESSLEEIYQALQTASENELNGILKCTKDPIVSSDCLGSSYSSIYDAGASIELNPTFFKLVSWYDNEMGYATRVVDLISYMSSAK